MIFLTGFEKFDKLNCNLSEQIVEQFPDQLENHSVEKLILPVSWQRSLNQFQEKLNKLNYLPTIILNTGIHEKKYTCIEERAYNFKVGFDEDHRYKFNLIKRRLNCYLRSNIDIKNLVNSIGIYADLRVSTYPGLYLCNYIYYNALFYYKRYSFILFVHFPKNGSLYHSKRIIESILSGIIMNYNKEKLEKFA